MGTLHPGECSMSANSLRSRCDGHSMFVHYDIQVRFARRRVNVRRTAFRVVGWGPSKVTSASLLHQLARVPRVCVRG